MTSTARTCTAVLALVSAGAFALPAVAEEMKFMAELSGAAQVPPVETEATGMADVTVDTEAMTISWTLTYEGLSGDPVAGHFHGPASPEETAPPVIDLTVDMEGADASAEGEVPQDIMDGSSELTGEQMADLQAGLLYINLHTEQHPDGEIRGQVMEGEAERGADAAAAGDTMPAGQRTVPGADIAALVSGKTLQGTMADRVAYPDPYAEVYNADGTVQGDGYTATWRVEGDRMCITYGEDPEGCYDVVMDGEQVQWLTEDGEVYFSGTLVDAEPNEQ